MTFHLCPAEVTKQRRQEQPGWFFLTSKPTSSLFGLLEEKAVYTAGLKAAGFRSATFMYQAKPVWPVLLCPQVLWQGVQKAGKHRDWKCNLSLPSAGNGR